MSSNYGNKIKFQYFGQSHSDSIGVVIDGLPAGKKIDLDKINEFMSRRAPGFDQLSTPRKETDSFNIVSGLFNDKTCGAPLCAIIGNTNIRSSDYTDIKSKPRPSHADYTAFVKYNGFNDINGGGHFSGRLTAPLCFAGAVALQFLEDCGISVLSHIYSIGKIFDDKFNYTEFEKDIIIKLKNNRFPVINDDISGKMQNLILEAKQEGDSVGGIIECAVLGLKAGVGDPIYRGIESCLAEVIFGIPAVKGLEFGNGFEAAFINGSENNDAFYYDKNKQVKTKTNNSGGINGGISNGMPIIFRTAVKPTPSIGKEQNTINLTTQEDDTLIINGRHDPCIVARACSVIEAAAATVILDLII
ncbi:chorismate synthase [Eubacteriales bacterium OttesenSCG-928-G02]|nr:chorismate synthase [Eubacteriales bacterium OttesenSCG-928-G02]